MVLAPRETLDTSWAHFGVVKTKEYPRLSWVKATDAVQHLPTHRIIITAKNSQPIDQKRILEG